MTTLPNYIRKGIGLRRKGDISNKVRHSTMTRQKRRKKNKMARESRRKNRN